jgi:hypothetical protein
VRQLNNFFTVLAALFVIQSVQAAAQAGEIGALKPGDVLKGTLTDHYKAEYEGKPCSVKVLNTDGKNISIEMTIADQVLAPETLKKKSRLMAEFFEKREKGASYNTAVDNSCWDERDIRLSKSSLGGGIRLTMVSGFWCTHYFSMKPYLECSLQK